MSTRNPLLSISKLSKYYQSRTLTTWKPVIGLEIHAQIASKTKLFSATPNLFAESPNTLVSPFDAAFPGTLPKLNPTCLQLAARAAIALESHIQPKSSFERKHYFYHDQPAGYQITQRKAPFALGGTLRITPRDGIDYEVALGIEQIQLEQDTGKSSPDLVPDMTLVDLNRAGTGLLEIVLKPEISTSKEAGAAVRKLQEVLRHAGVSEASMDEGSFRCDVNISVHRLGEPFGSRTELKNLATVKQLSEAVDAEIHRQISLLESGGTVSLETRGYDPVKRKTFRLRNKGDAPEYRYMPEPDLPTMHISESFIHSVRSSMPESIEAQRKRLTTEYGLSESNAVVIMGERGAVEYFEKVAKGRDAHLSYNWIVNNLFRRLHEEGLTLAKSPIRPDQIGSIIDAIQITKSITGKLGKQVLKFMMNERGDGKVFMCEDVLKQTGWKVVDDQDAVREACKLVIESNPAQIQDALSFPETINMGFLHWFVGETMKRFKNQASPQVLQQVMKEELELVGVVFLEGKRKRIKSKGATGATGKK